MLFLNLCKITDGHSENCIISQCVNKYSLLIEDIQTNLKCSEANVAGTSKSLKCYKKRKGKMPNFEKSQRQTFTEKPK